MNITVNFHQGLRHLTNEKATVSVSNATVGECLDELVQKFPAVKPKLFGKNGKLLNYVDIYVNQDSSYPEDLAKPVKAADRLSITLTLAGE